MELPRKISEAIDRYGEPVLTAVGVSFWLAFVAMFFEKWFPFLHPFITWTFRIYLGSLAALLIGLVILSPGILIAKDLHSEVFDPKSSPFEKRLTWIWCAGGGLLFALLIAASFALEIWGNVANIKLWFIALCWLVLMVPYGIIGYLARRFIHSKQNSR